MVKKYRLKKSVVSSMLTFVVIFSLILSGPASAVTLTVGTPSQSAAYIGTPISFMIDVDIQDSERMDVDNITVYVGENDCAFDASNGANISVCSNFTVDAITPLVYDSYGYGYGYGIDAISQYNITWTPSAPGNYSISFVVNSGSTSYNSTNSVPLEIVPTPMSPSTTLTATYVNSTPYVNGTWTGEDVQVELSCNTLGQGCGNINYTIYGLETTSGNYTTPLTINETATIVAYSFNSTNDGAGQPVTITVLRAAVIESNNTIFENVSFEYPLDSTPESAANVTTFTDWDIDFNVTLSNSSNATAQIIIPAGTTIARADGNDLNVSAITAAEVAIATLSGVTGNSTGALQFGIPNLGLTFDPAINISIPVTALDGANLTVLRSTSGTGGWVSTGIVNNTCTVAAGLCTFQTTKASFFIAGESITATPTSSGGSSPSGTTSLIAFPPTSDDEEVLLFMERNDVVEFNYGTEEHSVKVNRIGRDTVEITIASVPTTYTLSEGESVQKDLDGDGDMDLEVTVTEIVSYRSASFEFTELTSPSVITYRDPVVTKAPVESSITVEDTNNDVDDTPTTTQDTTTPPTTPAKSSSLMWLVYLLLGVAVIAAVVVGIKKRK